MGRDLDPHPEVHVPDHDHAAEPHRPRPTAPPSDVVAIRTEQDAHDLAARLLTPGRTWPVAVVSTAADIGRPYVDATALKAEVGDLVEVVLVPTGRPSWAFSESMPPRTQVYGGASRVYGVEHDWVRDPYRSRLRFAYTPQDGAQVLDLLVHDSLGAAVRAGLVGSATRTHETTSPRVVGHVRGVVGQRAFVTLDDGSQAIVAQEATITGVPLGQVLQEGQRVTGTLDRVSHLLDLGASLPDDVESRRLVQHTYRAGDVVLARVRDADADTATLELAPRYACRVPRARITGNELDHVDDLVTPGETVVARTVASPGGLTLRLDDINDADDTPIPALALLPGGPPWLTVDEPDPPQPTAPAPVADVEPATSAPPAPAAPTAPAHPTPAVLAHRMRGERTPMPRPATAPPTTTGPPAPATHKKALQDAQLALAEAKARAGRAEQEAGEAQRRARALAGEQRLLLAEIEDLRGQVDKLENQLRDLRTKYRRADRNRQLAQREPADQDAGPWFTDPADQFRHEVHDAWVRTVAPGEKKDLPLGRYALGPRFLDSLDRVEGVSRRKIAETVVHVVVGRARDVNGLQLHPLRTDDGGGSPARTRGDGATCWRVSLQVHTPSARRLHFWRLPDGSVELSRVVLHDDVEP